MTTAPPLVQSLPYVLWTLLFTLALGSFAFVVITHRLTDATTGYVRFMSATGGVLALLAVLVDPTTPSSTQLVVEPSNSLAPAITLLTFVFAIWCFVCAYRMRVGAVGLIAGALVVGAVATAWAPTSADSVPLMVQLVTLSFVTGGSLAAIVLGHWYLVTPKISEKPLILQCRMLLVGVALQALLFVTWTTVSGGPDQPPFTSFTTGPVLLVVLRALVTIAFPVVLTYMAWRTAQTRSMESATGLLYINLAAVMAGTIGAAALYVSSGILV